MRQLVLGYDELKLRIERRDAGSYHVFASTGSAEVSTEFELPFGEHEVENFILKVSRPRGRRRVATSAIGDARSFGGRLFTALFHEEVLSLYRDALSEARSEGRGVRITLCLSKSPELIDVPWEYLFDEPDFLAVSAFTPVVRYLDLPRGHRPLIVEPPLRLLGVVSSPADYEQLDVERERSNLEGALSELSAAGAIELHWLERPTLGGLLRALQSETFHALHYIGHGAYDRDTETGVLLFEDDAGWSRPVTGDKLGMIVHDFSSLRLTVLNACEGARTARSDPFAGVAGSLVRRDIPAVVAMQFEISDEAAIVFAGGFYRPLAAGAPVDTSLGAARLAMLAERSDDIEWGTPVLFMRVPDGRLFDLHGGHGVSDAEAVEKTDTATDAATTDDVPVVAASARAGFAPASPARGNGAAAAEAGRSASAELTREESRRRGRRRRVLVVSAVAAVLVIVAGAVTLNTGGPGGHKKPPGPSTASVRPFTIRYTRPWLSVAGTSPMLQRSHRLVYGDETLDVGQLKNPAPVPGGSPPALTSRYGKADVSVNAQVAGHDGREYAWLSSRGEVVAYVLPTTVGDDAIICHGPTSAAVALQSCGDLARRADASGETILAPGPDRQLAAGIASALRPVATARAAVRSLGGDAAARAQKAAGIAKAELRAVEALKPLATPPRYRAGVASLTTALQHEATEFTTLADDAHANNLTAYPGAAKGVMAASRLLAGAATTLAMEYQLGVRSLRMLSIGSSLPSKSVAPSEPSGTATQQTTTQQTTTQHTPTTTYQPNPPPPTATTPPTYTTSPK
jgi:hypothetical protein